MLLFDQPPPAVIVPKPKEIIRPGDPRFVIPEVAGIVGVVRKKTVFIPPATAYTNPLGQGDRTASITVTSSFSPVSGTLNNLVDGATASNGTDAVDVGTPAYNTSSFFQFDFGSGKYWDEFRFKRGGAVSNGTWGVWANSSSGLSGATLVAAGQVWDATTETYVCSLGGRYRYCLFAPTSGSGNMASDWYLEVEFKIEA